jgi:spermidine/putrescine transport system ATP-binding protein
VSDTAVELRGVIKRHGPAVAADRVALQVRRGEFFSLLGPSGSGKTTLLRLIAGFDRPDEGEVLIDGRSMRDVPPNLRPVNLVFQHYALFPHLTVSGNVAFGLEMRGLAPDAVRAQVADALAMVRLTGKDARLPHQLSGGEQQRVALARALVNRPAVVLLDEPLGALDQQLRQDMQTELKAIQRQVGLTFICVTHHQEEALTMSDRLAVLDHGRVLQIGSPQDVYDRPASLFVAGFVGVSNRVEGMIASETGGRVTVQAPALPPIQARGTNGMSAGVRATVVVRPERVHVSREAGRNGFENAVPAVVDQAVYNGHETRYRVRLGEEVLWTVRLPNDSHALPQFSAGDRVILGWKADDAVVLTA